MVNRDVFKTQRGRHLPAADTVNRAGGTAYGFGPEHALAQLAVTGCLNNTYYAGAGEQLSEVLQAARRCQPAFVARTAVYARRRGYMKDMPALLLAFLAVESGGNALDAAWPHVVDNGRMLRNFVQIIRSGALGRKSFGTMGQNALRQWFESRSPNAIT